MPDHTHCIAGCTEAAYAIPVDAMQSHKLEEPPATHTLVIFKLFNKPEPKKAKLNVNDCSPLMFLK